MQNELISTLNSRGFSIYLTILAHLLAHWRVAVNVSPHFCLLLFTVDLVCPAVS